MDNNEYEICVNGEKVIRKGFWDNKTIKILQDLCISCEKTETTYVKVVRFLEEI